MSRSRQESVCSNTKLYMINELQRTGLRDVIEGISIASFEPLYRPLASVMGKCNCQYLLEKKN